MRWLQRVTARRLLRLVLRRRGSTVSVQRLRSERLRLLRWMLRRTLLRRSIRPERPRLVRQRLRVVLRKFLGTLVSAASAAGANADAELAGEHVTEAAARATAAAASATDAATSSKAAADSASEAIEAAESATRQAAEAAASATAAAGSETAAEGSATAAAASATAAAGSATAAAGSATAAAASAAKLGDAALKGANNSFSGTNTFNGQLVANSGLSVQGVPLADVIVGECDHVRHMACASFGDTPMEFLPSTYAEWAAENAAALSGDKNTLSVLLSAAEADARTLPTGYKKITYFNMGKMGALKIAEATNALYIYERATNVQAWNMAGISAKVVTLVYPELTKIKDAFYNIKAQRVNLVFPKLSAVTTYGFDHLAQGVTEARFYMPQLSRGMTMFSQCALSAASLLSLAKTLPVVASAQVITIGAAAALESDSAFQTALAAALAGKNWTFKIKYN